MAMWPLFARILLTGHAGAEMSLGVLAYNFERVLSILGFEEMMKAMKLAGA
jgi:hypothetical protein